MPRSSLYAVLRPMLAAGWLEAPRRGTVRLGAAWFDLAVALEAEAAQPAAPSRPRLQGMTGPARSFLWNPGFTELVDAGPFARPPPYVFGFSNGSRANLWRQGLIHGVQFAASEHADRIAALRIAHADEDAAAEARDIDAFLAMGVDALIVSPLETEALLPALARARAAGLPVIMVDRRAGRRVAFAGPGRRPGHRHRPAAGAMAGRDAGRPRRGGDDGRRPGDRAAAAPVPGGARGVRPGARHPHPRHRAHRDDGRGRPPRHGRADRALGRRHRRRLVRQRPARRRVDPGLGRCRPRRPGAAAHRRRPERGLPAGDPARREAGGDGLPAGHGHPLGRGRARHPGRPHPAAADRGAHAAGDQPRLRDRLGPRRCLRRGPCALGPAAQPDPGPRHGRGLRPDELHPRKGCRGQGGGGRWRRPLDPAHARHPGLAQGAWRRGRHRRPAGGGGDAALFAARPARAPGRARAAAARRPRPDPRRAAGTGGRLRRDRHRRPRRRGRADAGPAGALGGRRRGAGGAAWRALHHRPRPRRARGRTRGAADRGRRPHPGELDPGRAPAGGRAAGAPAALAAGRPCPAAARRLADAARAGGGDPGRRRSARRRRSPARPAPTSPRRRGRSAAPTARSAPCCCCACRPATCRRPGRRWKLWICRTAAVPVLPTDPPPVTQAALP